MTRNDIINMAREADLIDFQDDYSDPHIKEFLDVLERFAALVAQAEREACAAICDQQKIITPEWQMDQHYNQATSHCA